MKDVLWAVAEYSSIAVCFLALVWIGIYCVAGIIDKIRDIKGG